MTEYHCDQYRFSYPEYEEGEYHAIRRQHHMVGQQHDQHNTSPRPYPLPVPLSSAIANSTTSHIMHNHNQQDHHNSQNIVEDTSIHPERCPPLKLDFMWKLYRERNDPTDIDYHYQKTEERIRILQSQGFPTGLAALMLQHSIDHPIRIFLLNNSGSMLQNDRYLVTQECSKSVNTVPCTRWEAITSTIVWHAEMAAWCQNPMAVRLVVDPGIMVGPQQLGVAASKHHSSKEEVTRLQHSLRATRPNGAASPFLDHLKQFFPSLSNLVPILIRQQRRITLCICTDSIPTDAEGIQDPEVIDDFLRIIERLLDWPIQVVIRLCTSDERIKRFYRNLLSKRTASRQDRNTTTSYNSYTSSGNFTNCHEHLQVLDDYVNECEQIRQYNPWLNYGYPLHLCREEGICIKVIEALSQRPLRANEVLAAAGYLFGEVITDTDIPASELELFSFRHRIAVLNDEAGVLWNPIKKKFVPWIDLKQLDKIYFRSGGKGRHDKFNTNGDSKCMIM